MSAANSCAEPATSSLVPTATNSRDANAGDLLAAQSLPRAADAGGERLADRIWSARRKLRNMRPVGSLTSASDGASSASAMVSGRPTPSTRRMPSPPRIDRAHARRMIEREERRDARAHRIAHHVGALDLEMIEQRAHVVRHVGAVIGGRIVQLARLRHGRDCRARSRAVRRASASPPSSGATQLTSLVEAKPCTSTIGSPCALVEIGDLDRRHCLKLAHGRRFTQICRAAHDTIVETIRALGTTAHASLWCRRRVRSRNSRVPHGGSRRPPFP